MKVMGIDLGFVTSATGIAIFDTVTHNVDYMWEMKFDKKQSQGEKIDELIEELIRIIYHDFNEFGDDINLIMVEKPYLKGKAFENFMMACGAIRCEFGKSVKFIHPMTVKKFMGTLDKEKMAKTLLKIVSKKSVKTLKQEIKSKAWDRTDALAIAYVGSKLYVK